MNDNNKVVIHHNRDNNEVTFQAIGNSEFVESMTDKVLKEYFGYSDSEPKTYIKTYSNEGYHGEVISSNIDRQMKHLDNEEYKTNGKRTHKVTGESLYRCRYKCPECEIKSNRYITENTRTIYCHNCNASMQAHSNKEEYGKDTDKFGNYYYAGNYIPFDLM